MPDAAKPWIYCGRLFSFANELVKLAWHKFTYTWDFIVQHSFYAYDPVLQFDASIPRTCHAPVRFFVSSQPEIDCLQDAGGDADDKNRRWSYSDIVLRKRSRYVIIPAFPPTELLMW